MARQSLTRTLAFLSFLVAHFANSLFAQKKLQKGYSLWEYLHQRR